MFLPRRALVLSLLLPIFGAGCIEAPISRHVAVPLRPVSDAQITAARLGFGELGSISRMTQPSSQAQISISATLPPLPVSVTVLRIPSQPIPLATFQTFTQAFDLAPTFVPSGSSLQALNFSWTDDHGMRHAYDAITRILTSHASETSVVATTSTTLTTDRITYLAGTFLLTHGINPKQFREPEVRDLTVHYPLRMDDLAVVDEQFQSIDAVRLRIRPNSEEVADSYIRFPADPNRSDYPAITSKEFETKLQQGRIMSPSPLIGQINIHQFESAYLATNIADQNLLIPIQIAKGIQTFSDGRSQPITMGIPMVR